MVVSEIAGSACRCNPLSISNAPCDSTRESSSFLAALVSVVAAARNSSE